MHTHSVWAEIDLSAIAHNVRELRRLTRPQARLLAAVKAEAYGHGAVEVGRTALANGASALGVARVEEGLALRRAGIRAPILVFGYTPDRAAGDLLAQGLATAVYSAEHAAQLAAAARGGRRALIVHVKIDTGMGRLGIPCDGTPESVARAAEDILCISRLEGLQVGGLFTHFATSDHADQSFARLQFQRFQALDARLAQAGLRIAVRHAANSAAIITMPETHMDMVRAGIAVYGLAPSGDLALAAIRLRPAMTLKARIVHVKQVPAGTPISYGCTYRTSVPTTIATVPVGYGDGYSRMFSNRGIMLVGGRRVPVVGRVCMDLTMVDVGSVPEAKPGDEAVILGRQGSQEVTADELAGMLTTINYEIVTALTARVPRVYTGSAG